MKKLRRWPHTILRKISERMGYVLLAEEDFANFSNKVVIANSILDHLDWNESISQKDVKYIYDKEEFRVHILDKKLNNVVNIRSGYDNNFLRPYHPRGGNFCDGTPDYSGE